MQMGMILHTWGQQLSLHPHLHCIPGGINRDGTVEKHKNRWQILVPSKGFVKVLGLNIAPNSRRNHLSIRTNQAGFMEKTVGCFC
jgi:hypothetical protein